MSSVSTTNVGANVVLCKRERMFSVPIDYFDEMIAHFFPMQDPISFLNVYSPTVHGEVIYQKAKADNKIVEEGDVL